MTDQPYISHMNAGLQVLLRQNGYIIYQTNEYLIVRRQVFASWWVLLLLLILGVAFLLIGFALVTWIEDWSYGIFPLVLGVVLLIAPFFNYLTASYRSLAIDLEHQTLLFRSGYSRAYLFTEVKDLKLEVQAKQTSTHAFSDSNKEFNYTITLYMNRGEKEELLSLKFTDEDNERRMFELKDYFQTLLSVR